MSDEFDEFARQVTIRPFDQHDVHYLARLWNRCLPKDPLTPERFWRLFLLDPNFDPAGALVAADFGDKPLGFLQAMVRREPYGSLGTQPEQGWITAFFVDPERRREGIGSRLLDAGLAFLREKGRTRVSVNGYAPHYVFPGVDVDYAEAHAFLTARGFTSGAEAVAMGMELEGVTTPPAVRERAARLKADGYSIRPFTFDQTVSLLAFCERHFPHWTPCLRDSLLHGGTEVMVAEGWDESGCTRIVGYAQWQNPHNDPPHGASGRFGPFGVHPDLRGNGLGAVIFYELVERVRAQGARHLWFGWAGGRNLSFYERAGCRVTRRYRLYVRPL